MFVIIALLRASLRLLFAKPLQAIKAIVPGVIACVLAVTCVTLLMDHVSNGAFSELAILGVTLINFIVVMFAFSVLATGWHRFALMDLDPSHSARATLKVSTAYFIRACALGGIASLGLILTVVIVFGVSLVLGAASSPTDLVFSLAYAVVFFFCMWIAMRCVLVLPAAALGVPMKFRASWALTRPIGGPVFFSFFIIFIGGPLLQLIAKDLLGSIGEVVAFVLTALLHLSLISVLYGHLVLERPLPYTRKS